MSHATIYDQFRSAAEGGAELPFLIYPRSATRGYLPDGAEISYGAALAVIDELATRYAAAGYRAGHRVALVLGNRPEHFFHLFALNRIGASAVPLNPDYLNHEFAFGIDLPKCALVVAAGPRMDDLRAVAAGLSTPVHVVDGSGHDVTLLPPAHEPASHPAEPEHREALIVYTSGTTGRPKGCMLSNLACISAGECYGGAGGLIAFEPRRSRVYNPFPSFHSNLSVYLLNAMVRISACVVVQDKFHISTWWSDLVETGANAIHYIGIIPPLLLKTDPVPDELRHKIKFGYGGGVDPGVRKLFEERFGFPLIEGWGMTETSRTIQNSELPRCLIDRAFGRTRPPLEVLIVDENEQPLPADTPGELLVRCAGPDPRRGFFSGYLNQPAETEHAWRNGWFHTGDVVKQLPDGMLIFVDRRKNIIRRSGENIAAAEIEQALIADARVHGAAVIAVSDEFHDEEIMACVVPMPGVPRTREIAVAMLNDARTLLARHKLPAWLAFVDELPVTGTQRVRKDLIFPEGGDPRTNPRTFDLRAEKKSKQAS